MPEAALPDTFYTRMQSGPGYVERRVYYYHDIRIRCQTNHPHLLALLDSLLGMYPTPIRVRGEATYSIFCHESATQFPVQLPTDCIHTDTLYLLTNTRLKYYKGRDDTTEYQRFKALPPINEAALTVIDKEQRSALTQIEDLERYDRAFLRRYILLLALGELLRTFGFEPCHAAAVTAPENDRLGVLILGESGSGKTTLSLGCACSGYGLLGDDLVLLREDEETGDICAYAILPEVSVRSGSLDLWANLSFLKAYPADQRDKRYCSIEQIRPGAARLQVPVRGLIFPSLTGEQESVLTPLSRAATLQALLKLCISKGNMYPMTQARLFSLLARLTEQAQGYHIAVALGDSNAPQLLAMLCAEGML